MSTNIATLQHHEPRSYTASQLQLIQNTVAKDTTYDEFNMFIHVCKTMSLDPLRKQIHCIVYNKKNPQKRSTAFITGIDGFRAIADRSGCYRPDDAPPRFEIDKEAADPDTNPLGLVSATVKAFKRDQNGEWFPIVASAYWEEFAPLKEIWEYDEARGQKAPSGRFSLEGNWKKMARVMLAKCAEAQALRKGWPEDLSGIYSQEEMKVVENDKNASDEIEEFKKQERLKLINQKESVAFLWEAGEPLEFVPVGQVVDRCLAFIDKVESPTQLAAWNATNQQSLRLFWANHKNDCLEIKKKLEAKMSELEGK